MRLRGSGERQTQNERDQTCHRQSPRAAILPAAPRRVCSRQANRPVLGGLPPQWYGGRRSHRGTIMPTDVRAESRRQFLRFLAESPLLYGMGGSPRGHDGVRAGRRRAPRRLRLQGPHQEPRRRTQRLGLRGCDARALGPRPRCVPRARLRRPGHDRRQPHRVQKDRPQAAAACRHRQPRYVGGALRPTPELADLPVPRGRPGHVPRRGRNRRRSRCQQQELAPNSIDRRQQLRRGRSGRARRQRLAAALFHLGLADHAGHVEARRRRGLHRGCMDRRHSVAQSRARGALRSGERPDAARSATPSSRAPLPCAPCSTA